MARSVAQLIGAPQTGGVFESGALAIVLKVCWAPCRWSVVSLEPAGAADVPPQPSLHRQPRGTGRPGLLFHGLAALPVFALLWAFSVPGFMFPLAVAAAFTLVVFALVWLIRLVGYCVREGRASWWFAIVPLGLAIVIGLLVARVPLHARWALSQPAFAAAVSHLPPEPSADAYPPDLPIPGTLGSYRITLASRVIGGVIFHEVHGAFLDDAGFAYLPDGPTAQPYGDLQSPAFVHLSGPWYAWTAGW